MPDTSVLDLFPVRIKFVNPDGTLTSEAYRALRRVGLMVSGIDDNGIGEVFADVSGIAAQQTPPIPEQDYGTIAGSIAALQRQIDDLLFPEVYAQASATTSTPPVVSAPQPPTHLFANQSYTVNDFSQIVVASPITLEAGAVIIKGIESKLIRIIA
jgi:hypothetical protein